ncbi:MAG: oligosaccharide flippase family protein [Geobacter sp.]|nr:oligosaccharide flippase family protein [Geobacter sp.]
MVAPILVAIYAIPLLIKGLGTDRFGLLSLIWMAIGYFSLFDMGLGRALTQLVARKLGKGQTEEIPLLLRTATVFMILLGVLGALAVAGLSPSLVYNILKIPADLQDESLISLYIVASCIPIVITTAGLRGVLEAYQRFDLLNIVRIPMGIFTFLGPLLTLYFTSSLYTIVAILTLGRGIALVIHIFICVRLIPSLLSEFSVDSSYVKPLLSFGGWITVTNVVGPIMVYLDRFLIGALASTTQISYYSTPYEVVNKLLLFPSAIVGVLFPAFSVSYVQNKSQAIQLYERAIKYIYIGIFPIVIIIVTLAHDGLQLWIGNEFAQHSTHVLQWLAVGVFINSLSQIPFTFIQGIGRPDLSSKLHLIELPIYLIVVWLLLKWYGIVGVAIAWTIRVLLDAILLFYIAHKIFINDSARVKFVKPSLIFASSLIIFIFGSLPMNLLAKGLFLCCTLVGFYMFSWIRLLNNGEREYLLGKLKHGGYSY